MRWFIGGFSVRRVGREKQTNAQRATLPRIRHVDSHAKWGSCLEVRSPLERLECQFMEYVS
jgi:hypothetical protein